jgi:hypothetical protein
MRGHLASGTQRVRSRGPAAARRSRPSAPSKEGKDEATDQKTAFPSLLFFFVFLPLSLTTCKTTTSGLLASSQAQMARDMGWEVDIR